ncbi:MAG: hypothetical protein KME60_09665 [Cyanomargarita calcarea GSE-NOS-MK-12-04C]|jgi:hypothetical protein|uniref:Uncharacterized protein n=1 Tax=Cyanomargarita calcarea GSE-NOS-MK-12-04C TaxID=2839659 RepID=A0A951QKQ4_9CYAN|nr:hypothetical protein [Cyanomargarita calcarea GSE-NOS-MK-12-04C]
MDSLEKQVQDLSYKLDALYQVIEQLDGKVSQVLSEASLDRTQAKDLLENKDARKQERIGHFSFSSEMEHKDVLVDGMYPDANIQGAERQLTPEIQIQRLTAQLTAAYNRIAALEEQLLLKRIHH